MFNNLSKILCTRLCLIIIHTLFLDIETSDSFQDSVPFNSLLPFPEI